MAPNTESAFAVDASFIAYCKAIMLLARMPILMIRLLLSSGFSQPGLFFTGATARRYETEGGREAGFDPGMDEPRRGTIELMQRPTA
jgi:hypothetical protein